MGIEIFFFIPMETHRPLSSWACTNLGLSYSFMHSGSKPLLYGSGSKIFPPQNGSLLLPS